MDSIFNYERSEDDDYYQILGCNETSSIEQINTEYKMRVLHCHPDKHPGDAAAAQRFTTLQTAKCVLTEPEERDRYDTWRRAGICIPYQQWRALRDNVHMSMHWATKSGTDLMLENAPESSNRCHGDQQHSGRPSSDVTDNRNSQARTIFSIQHGQYGWERDTPSEALMRFRNYKI